MIANFELMRQVAHIADSAGALILKYYAHDAEKQIRQKTDSSPVTAADLAADAHIKQELAKISSYPVRSEEDETASAKSELYWLIDPLDGTKGFIAHNNQFTVNIALVQGQRAILGAVQAPVYAECYYAASGLGAYRRRKDGAEERLHTRAFNAETFAVLLSSSHGRALIERLRTRWPQCKGHILGSSLKFCRIAEGDYDLYVRLGETNEWDTAAAQCVLEEAGGRVLSLNGDTLLYNKSELANGPFVAFGDPSLDIKALLADVLPKP